VNRYRAFVNVGLLYASKSGAVVVGIVVLPWYQRLLGSEAFGVVAMVLSLQAFLLMLDLGTSTLVSRDVAANDAAHSSVVVWRGAELLLHGAYSVLLIVAIAVNISVGAPMQGLDIALSVLLFWALTVQNVGQSALLAKRQYAIAAGTQVVGVLSRAAVTLSCLSWIRADLSVFLAAQVITAGIQMVVTSWLCRMVLIATPRTTVAFRTMVQSAKDLAIRGKPLVLFGLSGAAVLQLDKVIVPIFLSPSALTPYFLASALCLTPISVLAGPIAQYFQPTIIRSIGAGDATTAQQNLQKLTVAITCTVAIPSALLWLGRDYIIGMWLHQQPIAADVVRYVEILLPGIAIGALGFVPYTMLVAHQDFRAQASLSAAMTIITLMATAFAAAIGSVLAVCWIYAAYHSLSTVVSWLRSIRLQPAPPQHYATRSATHALLLIAGIFATAAVFSVATSFFHP
jgi:O-antigen/teichoic acid export membrane protein